MTHSGVNFFPGKVIMDLKKGIAWQVTNGVGLNLNDRTPMGLRIQIEKIDPSDPRKIIN